MFGNDRMRKDRSKFSLYLSWRVAKAQFIDTGPVWETSSMPRMRCELMCCAKKSIRTLTRNAKKTALAPSSKT